MEAEKKEQLLIIDPPHELKFRGPFTRPVMTVMTLTNPTDQNILFKIKTTAPRKYCVRPNFGTIPPHNKVEVEICLQAFVFDPNEKNKHKFMVQSYVIPDDVDNYQNRLKELDPDQFMNSKLRCVFEQPVEPPSGDAAAPGEAAVKENSSKAAGDEKSQDIQVNYKKAAAEVGQLREETSQLRQENLKLKEQLLRLRLNTEANQKEQTTSSTSSFQNPYSPPQIGQQQVPVMYIVFAIGMAIVGLLLGKFLL